MRRLLVVLYSGLVGVVVAVAGCCTRYKCAAPPTTVIIRDTAGNRVDGVNVAGSGLDPVPCAVALDCDFSLRGTGTITVTAPGYRTATAMIQPREDDCGNAVAQRVEVTLQPEDSAMESKVTSVAGQGCGS